MWVPQGLMLRQLFVFLFFCVNDLDVDVGGKISKYVYDTKIGEVVDSMAAEKLMAVKWQMKFNLDKCDVIRFGRSNEVRTYTMNCRVLCSIEKQGVLLSMSIDP